MLCFCCVVLHSEEYVEPELNSHDSAVVKTMIKGPATTYGKHCVCIHVIAANPNFPLNHIHSHNLLKSVLHPLKRIQCMHLDQDTAGSCLLT